MTPSYTSRMSEQRTGIKLQDLQTPTKASPQGSHTLQIEAYAKDVKRSLFIGGAAIVLELVLYFTKIVK
jgi:hypothetical protein